MAIKSNINANFPVEGRDQPSKGFRDNFKSAKEEIESLQSKKIIVTGDAVGVAGPVGNGKNAITLKLTMADNIQFPGNAGIKVPQGTTDQRPSSATPGTLRYNDTLHVLEVFAYNFNDEMYLWHPIGGGLFTVGQPDGDNDNGNGNSDGDDPSNPGHDHDEYPHHHHDYMKGVVELLKGDSENLSLYFDEDSDTGIYSPGNGHIAFVSNGTPIFRLGNGQVTFYGTFSVETLATDNFTLNGYTVTSISDDLINEEPNDSALVTHSSVIQYVSTRKLEDLADTTVSGPLNKDILHYNSTTNTWIHSSLDELDIALRSVLSGHLANLSNPHNVTATQVGLGNVLDVAQLERDENLADLPDTALARENLGVFIGTDVQAWDAILDSLSGVNSIVDSVLFINGDDVDIVALDTFIRTDLPATKTAGDITFNTGINVNFDTYTLQSDGIHTEDVLDLFAAGEKQLRINTSVSSFSDIDILGTKALKLPVGSTAQRPATTEKGQVRFNDDLKMLEYFNGTSWLASSDLVPWKVITTDTFVNKYEQILVDSTDGPITIQLPTLPSPGDRCVISDAAGTFYINNVTLDANLKTIMGSTSTLILDRINITVDVVYINDVYGWRIISR